MNGPRDEETQTFAYFACATWQVKDPLTLTPDVSFVYCTVFMVFVGI